MRESVGVTKPGGEVKAAEFDDREKCVKVSRLLLLEIEIFLGLGLEDLITASVGLKKLVSVLTVSYRLTSLAVGA